MNNQEQFDEAVNKKANEMMYSFQSQHASLLENSIKDALNTLELTNENLKAKVKELESEIDQLRIEKSIIKNEASNLFQTYLEENRQELTDFTINEYLKKLALTHLQSGKSLEDICFWLNVEPKFVENIIDIIDRKVNYSHSILEQKHYVSEHNPRLKYESHGRSGEIIFTNDQTTFKLWWEFGGNNVLLFIDIPNTLQWENQTGIPLLERDNTLRFIAEQVILDQTSGGYNYKIDETSISIYKDL